MPNLLKKKAVSFDSIMQGFTKTIQDLKNYTHQCNVRAGVIQSEMEVLQLEQDTLHDEVAKATNAAVALENLVNGNA